MFSHICRGPEAVSKTTSAVFVGGVVVALFSFPIFSLRKERKKLPKDTSRSGGHFENVFGHPSLQLGPLIPKSPAPGL